MMRCRQNAKIWIWVYLAQRLRPVQSCLTESTDQQIIIAVSQFRKIVNESVHCQYFPHISNQMWQMDCRRHKPAHTIIQIDQRRRRQQQKEEICLPVCNIYLLFHVHHSADRNPISRRILHTICALLNELFMPAKNRQSNQICTHKLCCTNLFFCFCFYILLLWDNF